MANFSVNQVNQMYVASALKTGNAEVANVGDIKLKSINNGVDTELYFLFKGADTVLESDFIQVKNLTSVQAVEAEEQRVPLKKVKVTLSAEVNGGNAIVGKDYIIGINFKNFFSSGDDSQYYKNAAVRVTAAMNQTPATFYNALKLALDAAFSREDGATKTANPYLEFTSDANGLYITEKAQEWTLGIKKARRIMFDVFCGEVYSNGEDVLWGTAEEVAVDLSTAGKKAYTDGTFIPNGQKIADLEWFCMGERGDQYRMVNWPNYIPTKYLVDPDKEYDVLVIHYGLTDTGVNSYRTEKEITIVAEKSTSIVADIKAALDEFLPATKASVDAAIEASKQ